ncbi:MAG: phosphoglycerate dehydrogenase [Dethiobacteria bacterium]|jgi:D-3-phosphoglycerate dehydrogenase|nr:phosphoglycerate dehydrogenase [Bacillota bacterium]HPZ64246.1 phosphoglycerate dehydrogenase [Bacillota bacterium]
MEYNVLVTPRSFAQWDRQPLDYLEQAGCRVERNPRRRPYTEEELIAAIGEADGLLVGIDPVTEKVMAAAPRLKVISKYGAGVDNIDLEAATRRGIVVTYTPGANSEAVADLTFGLMLAAGRLIVNAHCSVREGNWDRFLGVDLYGRTLGIVGTGKIGRAVARRARGFDMKVLAFTRNPDYEWAKSCGVTYTDLDNLLRESDFVSVHMALTPQTRNLINAQKLALMKPTSVIVNTARGGIIDEEALADALEKGIIFGAALDVYTEEPVKNERLLKLDRLVTTPHIAAYSRGALNQMGMEAADNLLRVLRQEKPEPANLVNPEVFS